MTYISTNNGGTEVVGDRQFWPTIDELNQHYYQQVFAFHFDGKIGAETDTGGEIYTLNEGKTWFLTWTDYVANSWREEYDKLSTAIARLAVLTACGERDWRPFLKQQPDAFAATAARFMEAQTT